MTASKDLTGKRFGKLVVVGRHGNNARGDVEWKCSCDCGQLKTAISARLLSGSTKSCGCLKKMPKHLRPVARKTKAHKKKKWDDSLRELLESVAKATGVSVQALMGDSKHHRIFDAKRLVFLVLRMQNFSYPAIAEVCGGHNHATVMSNLEQATAQDLELAEQLWVDWQDAKADRALTAEEIRREELFEANRIKWADMWRSDMDHRFKVAKIADEL